MTLLKRSPLYASAAIVLGLSSLALAACASSTTSNALSQPFEPAMRPPTTVSTPSPIPFKFTIVDDPNSESNQVTGINQLKKIVGVWGGGSGSKIWQSYTTQPPFTKFRDMDDPDTQGTFVTSITSNKIIAGYVLDPKKLHGVYAFAQVKAEWILMHDPNEGKGRRAVTEILGISDSELAVGFYENAGGTKIPFEVNVPNAGFTDLQPPSVTGDAAATGINGKGDITGWETTSGGAVKSYFLQAGTYYPFSYSGAVATYALSINWSDQVVGYYVDASGMRHGFLLIGPSKGGGQQVWQTIDYDNATGTVVTGINNHHDICGYYVDASGVQHGFVAEPGQ